MKNLKQVAAKKPTSLDALKFRTAIDLFWLHLCGDVHDTLSRKKPVRLKTGKVRKPRVRPEATHG